MGSNTGNVLFCESLNRVLLNAKRCTYHFKPREVEDCDAIVIAAANWINPYSDFGGLANRLEKSGLPVILCGIGLQMDHHPPLDLEVSEGTMRLLRLASETSKYISARGDKSCSYLKALGIDNVVSTGCPSLLLAGELGPRVDISEKIEFPDIVVHGTRHMDSRAHPFHAFLYQQALVNGHDLLLQSELIDMDILMDTDLEHEVVQFRNRVLEQVFDEEIVHVREYLKTHGKVFTELQSWLEYMGKKKFSFGSRVHGTIASLLAGCPAVLAVHDERTLELAEKMALPHVSASEIDTAHKLDPREYANTEQFRHFERSYRTYREHFIEYFRSVGLAFDSGYSLGA